MHQIRKQSVYLILASGSLLLRTRKTSRDEAGNRMKNLGSQDSYTKPYEYLKIREKGHFLEILFSNYRV